jgi:chitinase
VFQNGVSIGAVTTTNRLVTGLTPSTTFTFKVLASDEAGSSAQSSPISVTTLPVNTGGLPKHLLMGYWQDFSGNGAMPLTIAAVPSGYTIIAVAFANSTATPGAVSFTLDPGLSAALGGYTTAQFMADIVAAHAKGQKVIISVGGQNGSITVSDATSATNFANSVHQIMTTFGFDGVDIDLENTVSPTFMGSALRQLVALSPGAIITMAPETLFMQSTGATYFQLALNVKDILTMINTQYYNSGTMLGCDQAVYSQATENFITALACIQFQGGLDPSQVGIGMPATDRATNSPGQGFQPPANINAAVDCLTKGTNCGSFKPPATWPTLRGVMTWDINWDATGGFTFVNTVQPHLAALP